MNRIIVCNTNQGKPNTCGSCKHTDNNLGLVALHCDLLEKEGKGVDDYDYSKVRSWERCYYLPTKYVMRVSHQSSKKEVSNGKTK